MRITKVYTKTGDAGQTGLVGGDRVSKSHPRIQAYGGVDELNATLGVLRYSWLNSSGDHATITVEEQQLISTSLHRIQNHLFNIGADLATPSEHRWEGMIRVGDMDTDWLEEQIDHLNEALSPLLEFILPGGSLVGAQAHHSRTVCRRVEIQILELFENMDPTNESDKDLGILKYINRLSDYLFVAGRWMNLKLGASETLWQKKS